MAEAGETVVPLNEFHAFVIRVMCAVGVQESDANSLADLLVSADYRGHYSHGLNRLGKLPFHLSCYPTSKQTRATIDPPAKRHWWRMLTDR